MCKQATFSHYSQCKAPRVPHAVGTLALTPHVGQTENKTGKHPSHSNISTVSAVIYLISMLVMRASPSMLMTEYFSAPMRFWKWMVEPSDRATWNSSGVNVMTILGGREHARDGDEKKGKAQRSPPAQSSSVITETLTPFSSSVTRNTEMSTK